MNFKQIIECTVEYLPAGRRNGIDCQERNIRGLLGIDESGFIHRYDYSTKSWALFPAPTGPSVNNPPTES